MRRINDAESFSLYSKLSTKYGDLETTINDPLICDVTLNTFAPFHQSELRVPLSIYNTSN